MKKTAIITVLAAVSLACNCAHVPQEERGDLDFVKSGVKITVVGVFKNPTPEPIMGEASGVIVGVHDNVSYILSVSHATRLEYFLADEGNEDLISIKMFATGMLGENCELKELATDAHADLSLLACDVPIGAPASVSVSSPDLGDHVMSTGAPWGVKPRNFFPIMEGRFFGIDDNDDNDVVLSVPAASGSSGSGVFFQGKLLCVIKKVAAGLNQISFCSNVDTTREFLRKHLPLSHR